jgi:hypothetical protein
VKTLTKKQIFGNEIGGVTVVRLRHLIGYPGKVTPCKVEEWRDGKF